MNSRFAMGVLVASTLLAGVYEEAAAATLSLCQHNKTGVLRVAASCKKKETALTINTEGPAGAAGVAGAAGAQGAQGPEGPRGFAGALEVFDAEDQRLGYLVDTDFRSYQTKSNQDLTPRKNDLVGVTVYIPEMGVVAKITPTLAKPDVGDIYDEIPWFQSADCTGTAFYDASVYLTFPNLVKRGPDYYRVTQTGLPTTLTIHSYGGDRDNCVKDINENNDIEVVAVKEEQVRAVDLPFKLPVKYPLRFQER